MTEKIAYPEEFVDDQEMADAQSQTVGQGTPQTAPHEPVKLTLWERLSRRFPKIPEED
jgi:hypothetical protein